LNSLLRQAVKADDRHADLPRSRLARWSAVSDTGSVPPWRGRHPPAVFTATLPHPAYLGTIILPSSRPASDRSNGSGP